ncbi:MAG: DUF1707 SHOCT-like domain-containing protein [Haloechinothrix sp.]
MNVDQPELRLSDAERQDALDALGEHMRAGRLDIDEYGDRSALISTARTRGELLPLFADLPQPRPAVLRDHLPLPVQQRLPTPSAGAWLASSAVPIAAVLAIVLFVTVARGFWLVFLLPAAVALVIGAASSGRWRPGKG